MIQCVENVLAKRVSHTHHVWTYSKSFDAMEGESLKNEAMEYLYLVAMQVVW